MKPHGYSYLRICVSVSLTYLLAGEMTARAGSSIKMRFILMLLSGLASVVIGFLWIILLATGDLGNLMGH